ncbi:lysophospholipase [Choiromyces venosus 120613-1]|uniref:Lysophospholipase n=1 Tax=Choiromyces venosus 120613-1 TaxID=1336337 RepID=A0A3N4JG10_9PEZI|nr:lysophospholipase [Choiromyces venosus 120613-1]
MVDFDVGAFMNSYSPTIGIAFSGGGYRAMLSGAGEFKAMDSRTPGSTAVGRIGGLLQSAKYIAGLSGGSWLLGSIAINNFTTIDRLQSAGNVWDFENSILAPEGALHIVDTTVYYNDLNREVQDKMNAGFDVSLTDYWSRALSRQFVNHTNGGPGITYSSIAKTDHYKNAEMPFPIVIADGRNPGETIVSSNATIYEYNPLEFGSFDPTLYAFTPIGYIGSNVSNGVPVESGVCARGFDNVGFVMGTSSSLFNVLITQLDSLGLTSVLKKLVEATLNAISAADNDIADYSPNPFFGVNPDINPSARTRDLTLVDGGLDGQNIPLHPLIQPTRKVDVIFAMDNSADTVRKNGQLSNWPNGTAIIATYERAINGSQNNGTLFPAVPDVNTFINLGLNSRPTFFGCDARNITTDTNKFPPLVVYIPNSPYTFNSNISTTEMVYSASKRDLMIENGYNIATRGNASFDQNWPACVGCAIVRREQERKGQTQTAQCQKCFKDYCWDGTRNSAVPNDYEPTALISAKNAGTRVGVKSWGTAIVAALSGLVSVASLL